MIIHMDGTLSIFLSYQKTLLHELYRKYIINGIYETIIKYLLQDPILPSITI